MTLTLIFSCKKETQFNFTHIHLDFMDWITNDSVSNFPFSLESTYSGVSYSFQTNQFGRFDTLIQHLDYTDFKLKTNEGYGFYLYCDSNLMLCNKSTQRDVFCIREGTFNCSFVCSIGGYIQNYTLQYLNTYVYPEELQSIEYTNPINIYSPTCNSSQSKFLLPGDYAISYQKRANYSSPWTTVNDTVTIVSGQSISKTIYF